MNGKKVAIYFVGFIILVCILIVIAMQIFFHTYEPKTNNGEDELSSINHKEESTPYIEII